ncbi:hypothetical protein ACLKA7_009182 [Drosophila subpalustris]
MLVLFPETAIPSSVEADGELAQSRHEICSDTKHLMDWLLNEYRVRTALATGHEALQVEYSVVEKNLDIRFSVTFHILLLSMEEFCRGSLCSFRCYLSNDPITAALSITELTTYLRQAAELDSSKPLYTLMYFHVLAIDGRVNCNTVQLLGLAHLACKQGDSGQDRVETNQVPQAVSKRISDSQIQLEEFESSVQDVNNSFKLVHDCMVEYQQQEQQLKNMRDALDEQCSNFMPIILESKAKLLQLINLMMRRT